VILSRAALILTNALHHKITPVMKMNNVTITMVVSNVNVLLDMSVIAMAIVSTLMNALPTILTFVTLPRASALITMAVTHAHVRSVTLVMV